ncbi:MAG: hypothetical protein J3Q66DRAFT_160153 [Benniella sp.]|nr:MAG: hypothetical protein J3Q66DRAFT_160153 [Benniella sp.]
MQQGDHQDTDTSAHQQQLQKRHYESDQNPFTDPTATAVASSSTRPAIRPQQHTHSRRRPSPDISSCLLAPRLQDHFAQAAQCAQALQDRNQDLEAENKRLKQLALQQRTSAIDWCIAAKQYEQDRNHMAVRLAELEHQIAKMTHQRGANHPKSRDPQKSTMPQEKGFQDRDADIHHDDDTKLCVFVSQSIAEILDHMAPSSSVQEPTLPTHSKGNDATGKSSVTDPSSANLKQETSPASRLAMKSLVPSKPSSCDCGCQEEIKALMSRCKYAEGQVSLKEMQCERMNVRLKSYKDKMVQWKETVVREQYQRRMKTPMSPEIARSAPLGSSQKWQQGQNSNQVSNSTTDQSHEGVKRTRSLTDESETSQERREATMRNTFFNRFSTGDPEGHNSSESPARSKSDRHAGMGSVGEPHVIFDDRVVISGLDNGDKEPNEQEELPTANSEDYDASAECPLSPTFPSEYALHRRQYLSDDNEEDDEDIMTDESRNGTLKKFHAPPHASPAARASEIRNQKRISINGSHQSSHDQSQQQSPEIGVTEVGDPLSIRSDKSSPPMFDFTDPQIPYPRLFEFGGAPNPHKEDRMIGKTLQVARQNGAKSGIGAPFDSSDVRPGLPKEAQMGFVPTSKNVRIASRGESSTTRDPTNRISHDQRDISVPATPLEQQGVLAMKHVNSRRPQSSGFGLSTNAGMGQQALEPDSQPRLPKAEVIMVDDDEVVHSQALPDDEIGSDEFNKENVVPPKDQFQEIRAYSSETARQGHRPADPDIPEQRIYNYTERRKDKRRQMHGHDCACCRRFYEITGPLPLPDGYNAFFTPAPRPGEKSDSEKTADERLQERKQLISRHRVHHEAPLTPPGFWDTDFPPTPDRLAWDRIAEERRDRKKQRTEHDQRQQQQQQHQQYQSRRV